MKRALVLIGVLFALLLVLLGGLLVMSRPTATPPRVPGTGGAASEDTPRRTTERVPPVPHLSKTEHKPAPEIEIPPPRGHVYGRVTEPESPNGVPGCRVTLLHPTGREIARTVTDVYGKYEFRGLPELVPLVLRLEADGYLSGYCCNLTADPQRSVAKHVTLRRGPVVRVHVTTVPWNNAAVGARVTLEGDDVTAQSVTDEHGNAMFVGPSYGTFRLRVAKDGHASPPEAAVTLPLSDPDDPIEFRIHDGGTLAVRVETPQGKPAPGARVAVTGEGLAPREGLTDEMGVVTFERVHPGVQIDVTATGTDASVTRTMVIARDRYILDPQLRLPEVGVLRGTVLGERGERLPQILVRLSPESPVSGSRGASRQRTAQTDAKGVFELVGLLPGRWRVQAQDVSEFLEVRPGEKTEITLQVKTLTPRVVGRVVDLDGEPVAGLQLTTPSGSRAATDDEGRFVLERLPVGRRQRVGCKSEQIEIRSAGGRAPAVVVAKTEPADPVELVAIATGRVRTVWGPKEPSDDAPPAQPRTGAVTGRILGVRLHPLAGVEVAAGNSVTISDAEGRFRLDDVLFPKPPRLVAVRMTPPPGMYLPAFLRRLTPDDTDVLDMRQVHLGLRPYTRLARPEGPRIGGRWWVVSIYPDRFLGRSRPALEPVECVSYDGTWMLVPPAQVGRRAQGGALVATESPWGVQVAYEVWRPLGGSRPPIRFRFRFMGGLRVNVPEDYVGGNLVLRQVRTAIPREFARIVRSARPDFDPATVLARGTTITHTVERTSFRVSLAQGTYQAHLLPPDETKGSLRLVHETGTGNVLDFVNDPRIRKTYGR